MNHPFKPGVFTPQPFNSHQIARMNARKQAGYISNNNQVFGPLAFSPDSIQGLVAWYDSKDIIQMFQDSAGTIPVTGPEQPVGKFLDKSSRGNYLTQVTAAARPLFGARYNNFVKSQQFNAPDWTLSELLPVVPNADGIGDSLVPTAVNAFHTISQSVCVQNISNTIKIRVKAAGYNWVAIQIGAVASCYFDIYTGTLGTVSAGVGSIEPVSGLAGYYDCTFVANAGASSSATVFIAPADATPTFAGDGISGVLAIRADNRTTADSLLNIEGYQEVNTSSDYTLPGFPYYNRYDGVDNGLVSTLPGGGMVNGMDCFLTIKKTDPALSGVPIFSDPAEFFGTWQSGSAARPDSGAGVPTYYVDGVAIPATRGDIFTALTEYTWKILEIRDLNLSTWTSLRIGNYGGGFTILGDIAECIICTAQTADVRAKILNYMADGVRKSL